MKSGDTQPKVRFTPWHQPLTEPAEGDEDTLPFEYHQRPFAVMHKALAARGLPGGGTHFIRYRYWQFVPAGYYTAEDARQYLLQYLTVVEAELASLISRGSLAFWLHAYRRLYPGGIGPEKSPQTVGITRAVLEAAIQKHALFPLCGRVGISTDTPVERVFNGLLLAPEFELERKYVAVPGQLILASFGPDELNEVYQAEKLAYEIWRAGATLRSIAKGSGFVVEHLEAPADFNDVRTDDQDWLLAHYDNRDRPRDTTMTGVVYPDDIAEAGGGSILLPAYNVGGLTTEEFGPAFHELLHPGSRLNIRFNFIWLPNSLRRFRAAHLPFADAFRDKYGVGLDATLLVVAALGLRVLHIMRAAGGALYRYWFRAYEGPFMPEYIESEIRAFRTVGAELLDIGTGHVPDSELLAAIKFWTLTDEARIEIGLAYPGRHHIFLPCGTDRLFIDYAWIGRRFYDFFAGVSIPDQNFKGAALEAMVRRQRSALPTGACIAVDGTRRQIDAAFQVGKQLIIAECKAVSRSIGFDRGDPKSIRYRQQEVVDRILREADDKARWLTEHPRGTNYDIRQYQDILPVGVSPFVEYIPSRDWRYWVTPEIPRVLTPDELTELLKNRDAIQKSLNRVAVPGVWRP